jgi:hypothetical protein
MTVPFLRFLFGANVFGGYQQHGPIRQGSVAASQSQLIVILRETGLGLSGGDTQG